MSWLFTTFVVYLDSELLLKVFSVVALLKYSRVNGLGTKLLTHKLYNLI